MPSRVELESWLKAKGWGPAEAARHLHVNVRTVQRWLSGDRRIPDWVQVLRRALR